MPGTDLGLVGDSLLRAGAAGVGWSRSSSVEAAACVSTLCSCSYPCPLCVGAMCIGAQLLLHTCASSQVQTCQPVLLPASAACLAREPLAGHWLAGQSVAILVHVTSDPEHACSWPGLTSGLSPVCGMCGCMNRIPVSLLAGVCLCMCVPTLIWVSVSVPAWVARVCLDVGGVQGGEGVCVCVLLGILLHMRHLWARQV